MKFYRRGYGYGVEEEVMNIDEEAIGYVNDYIAMTFKGEYPVVTLENIEELFNKGDAFSRKLEEALVEEVFLSGDFSEGCNFELSRENRWEYSFEGYLE